MFSGAPDFEPFRKIGIGQHVSAVGFEVSQPGSDVFADVFAGTTGAVQDERLMPEAPKVVENLVFSVVNDVQVSETELVQFGHQVAEQFRSLVAVVEAHACEAGGKPNARAVGSDGRYYCAIRTVFRLSSTIQK